MVTFYGPPEPLFKRETTVIYHMERGRSGAQHPPQEENCTRRLVADDEQKGTVHDKFYRLRLVYHRPRYADDHRRCRRRLCACLVDLIAAATRWLLTTGTTQPPGGDGKNG